MDSNLLLLAAELKKLKKKVASSPIPAKGDKGEKGNKGETGAKGAVGPKGLNGKDGSKGATGEKGGDGIDGVSVVDAEVDIDGTLAFSLSNGETIKTSGEVVGPKGPPGMQGANGVGLASGGTTGQVATKASDENYDVTWVSPFDPASPGTIGNTTPGAGSFTTLIGGAGSANYEQITGGATTKAVQFQTLGTDTNIPLAVQTKGTGAISLAAGSRGINISNGGTVTAITRTASGGPSYTSVPTVAITAPTTTGGIQATAAVTMFSSSVVVFSGGSGYLVGDVLTVSGGTGSAPTFTVATLSGSAVATVTITNAGALTALPSNPVSVTGGTGSGATFTIGWGVNTIVIGTAGSGYVEQPTVTFSGGGGSGAAAYASVGAGSIIRSLGSTGTSSLSFYVPSGEVLRLRDTGSPGTYAMINTTSSGMNFVAQGATNAFLGFNSNGTSAVDFGTNGNTGNTQLRVAHTASAVNYVQVTGAATGGTPTISAQGNDTNIALTLTAKGTGRVSSANIAQFTGGALYVNSGTTSTAGTLFLGDGTITKAPGSGFSLSSLNVTGNATFNTFVDMAAGSAATPQLKGSGGATGIYWPNGAAGTSIGMAYAGAKMFETVGITSGVNYLRATQSITGYHPSLSAQGTDTNIDLALIPKGAGNICFGAYTANMALVIQGYIEIKDSSGTVRKLAVIA